MLKIQEALDLIIEHYIDKLKEVRRGEGHTIPDRYALTILEDTEAIRNYVKPVLADRIRELDEQVPKIRIEDLTGEIEGKEGKTSSVWHTGKPPIEEIDKDNQYCYALCFYYDGWWLSDYLFKANHEDGCFENSPNNGQQVCKFKFCETIAWQKITPYEGEKE